MSTLLHCFICCCSHQAYLAVRAGCDHDHAFSDLLLELVSKVTQSAGAYIDWANLPAGSEGIKQALTMYSSVGANALDPVKVTTLQANLDQLIPGLAAVCLTLLVCKLLKKKVSPIVIILALFAVGIIGRVCGFM